MQDPKQREIELLPGVIPSSVFKSPKEEGLFWDEFGAEIREDSEEEKRRRQQSEEDARRHFLG